MLIRFAKLAGGLRLLITTTAPLVVSSSALLSARTVAYLVGFSLGSIGAGWLAIVATLVAVTGLFGAGANTAECEAYSAQRRAIDASNRAVIAVYEPIYNSWVASNAICVKSVSDYLVSAYENANSELVACALLNKDVSSIYNPTKNCLDAIDRRIRLGTPVCPDPPTFPLIQTYPSCSSPNCLPGKKVWVQVLWGSPTGNFIDSKGCFIVAYSQDAPDIPVNIEYNPFLPKAFVQSRAISYHLVDGDRFRGLNTDNWKNLESVAGWDKGYWKAEQTDIECRGWRPGWSRKVK